MKRAWIAFLFTLLFVPSLQAEPPIKDVDFKAIYKGGKFIGGLPPVLEKVYIINPNGPGITYKIKIHVKRASGDTNGRMVIFKAPTWRAALRKIAGTDPEFEKVLNATVARVVNMDAPFPTLELVFEYKSQLTPGPVDSTPQNPKGKEHFTQVLSKELTPGKHDFRLTNCTVRGNHVFNDVMGGWWWLSLAKNLFTKSTIGIGFKVFMGLVNHGTTCTSTKYTLTVKARVPKIKGTDSNSAAAELRKRQLIPSFNNTSKCMPNQHGQVLEQDPDPGKWVPAGKKVTARVCISACPAFSEEGEVAASRYCPPPTPPPALQYYVYNAINCGDTLFVAQEGSLAGRKMCSVPGCGPNCETDVQFSAPLAGPYPDMSAAQTGLCNHLSCKFHLWWGDFVRMAGKDYRCFHYSCSGAVSSYCPSLPEC